MQSADRLVIQCLDCGHFSMTEDDKWVCRHCSHSMIGFVEEQVRTPKTGRNIWKTFRAG